MAGVGGLRHGQDLSEGRKSNDFLARNSNVQVHENINGRIEAGIHDGNFYFTSKGPYLSTSTQ